MENYIVINGKKVELTDEQLKQLGINVEVRKKARAEIKKEIEKYELEFYRDWIKEHDLLFEAANAYNEWLKKKGYKHEDTSNT